MAFIFRNQRDAVAARRTVDFYKYSFREGRMPIRGH